MSQNSQTGSSPSPSSDGSTSRAGADASLAALESLANGLEGQPESLLELLRRIEQLHRSIQDGPFRSSLPADRNALFRLLAEMERSGGWPYIPRLQLRTFMDLLNHEAVTTPAGGSQEQAASPQIGTAEPAMASNPDPQNHPPAGLKAIA